MRRYAWLVGLAVAVCLAVPLGIAAARADSGKAGAIFLLCGAGLRKPVDEIIAAFQRDTGITVECSYAGSNVLLGQIKLSRRGDVYLPGEQSYVDLAAKEGLIASSKVVVYNTPVIMVKKGNPLKIRTLKDLTRPRLRVGVGDARAAAIGITTEALLKKNRIPMATLKRNIVFTSATVNELGDAIKLGHIDAAIVWKAVAGYYPADADAVAIPDTQNIPVPVSAAVLTTSGNSDAARKFVDFIASDAGKAIFARYHFDLPPAPAKPDTAKKGARP